MIKASCIIPVYNAGDFLESTIQSIRDQILTDIEIICVDDCSDDNSVEILKEIQKSDERLKVYTMEKRSGAAKCRNFGLCQAKGEYVVFLDADDEFYPDMLSIAYHTAIEKCADLVIWNYRWIPVTIKDGEESFGVAKDVRRDYLEVPREKVDLDILRWAATVPWNKFVRRSMLKEKGIWFQDLPSSNDNFFSMQVVLNAQKIIFLENKLMTYYYGRKSSLTQIRLEKECYLVDALACCYEYIKSLNHANISSKDYLNYVFECLQSHLMNSPSGDYSKQSVLSGLKENPVFKTILEECTNDPEIRLHNRVFVERILNNTYVIGEDYYNYYADEIREFSQESKKLQRKIALWGCGLLGKRLLDILSEQNISIDYVIDEDIEKQGSFYRSNKIYAYDEIKDQVDDILVTNHRFLEEISEKAKGKNIIYIATLPVGRKGPMTAGCSNMCGRLHQKQEEP